MERNGFRRCVNSSQFSDLKTPRDSSWQVDGPGQFHSSRVESSDIMTDVRRWCELNRSPEIPWLQVDLCESTVTWTSRQFIYLSKRFHVHVGMHVWRVHAIAILVWVRNEYWLLLVRACVRCLLGCSCNDRRTDYWIIIPWRSKGDPLVSLLAVDCVTYAHMSILILVIKMLVTTVVFCGRSFCFAAWTQTWPTVNARVPRAVSQFAWQNRFLIIKRIDRWPLLLLCLDLNQRTTWT